MWDTAGPRYARLRWRCRRGMRELDAVLAAFLQNTFATLDDADKSLFEAFLKLPDPELYAYLLGASNPEDSKLAGLVNRIRGSVRP